MLLAITSGVFMIIYNFFIPVSSPLWVVVIVLLVSITAGVFGSIYSFKFT